MEITQDKLFFEKIDIEVNRKLFINSFDENRIKVKREQFVQILQS